MELQATLVTLIWARGFSLRQISFKQESNQTKKEPNSPYAETGVRKKKQNLTHSDSISTTFPRTQSCDSIADITEKILSFRLSRFLCSGKCQRQDRFYDASRASNEASAKAVFGGTLLHLLLGKQKSVPSESRLERKTLRL